MSGSVAEFLGGPTHFGNGSPVLASIRLADQQSNHAFGRLTQHLLAGH
ncbi:MAG TPA: hypothetical protein VG713_18660 [Pirellulales bacterium]|nr:hypothetical protein [Pirellulales bacterium]